MHARANASGSSVTAAKTSGPECSTIPSAPMGVVTTGRPQSIAWGTLNFSPAPALRGTTAARAAAYQGPKSST